MKVLDGDDDNDDDDDVGPTPSVLSSHVNLPINWLTKPTF